MTRHPFRHPPVIAAVTLVGLSLASSVFAAESDDAAKWDFTTDRGGWQVWGTPKTPTSEQDAALGQAVTVDTTEGRAAKGALKIVDGDGGMGPYALGPETPCTAESSVTFGGGFKTTAGSVPELFVMFVDAENKNFKSLIGAKGSGAEPEIGPTDANGWRSFKLAIPAAKIPANALARPGVRPAASAGEGNAFIGTVWVDDVFLDQSSVAGRPAVNTLRDLSKWKEFVPGIRPTQANAVSLESLLDAPAGKHGVLEARDGSFRFADGTPVRFWGTNIHSSNGLFPTKEEAELVVASLARLGCNIVRFHLTEGQLIDQTKPGRQTMIAESDPRWEQFDYFVKCLADKGIYILLDSITGISGRKFVAADGIEHGEDYYHHKTWAFLDPKFAAISRKYMDGLLQHKNRYTGHTIATEPAIALMLLVNEQSAFFEWNIKVTPPYYRNLLQKHYNTYLRQKYGDRAGVAAAWGAALKDDEDPAQDTVQLPVTFFGSWGEALAPATAENTPPEVRARYVALVECLKGLQSQFFDGLIGHARTLGVKVPIVHTNVYVDLADLQPSISAGVNSQHAYWDHAQTIDGKYFVKNVPEVAKNPLRKAWMTPGTVTGVKVAGVATISTETDAMWPQEWRSGHLLAIAATASLQEIDGVFQYGYGGGWGYSWTKMREMQTIPQPCMEFNDPAMVGPFVAGALLYLRRDVSPAKTLVRLDVNGLLADSANASIQKGFYPLNYLPYVSRFENVYSEVQPSPTVKADFTLTERGKGDEADDETRARALDAELKRKGLIAPDAGLIGTKLISDTKQITRDFGQGLLRIDTPRSQGFTGFPSAEPMAFTDVTIKSRSPFATIQVSALDGDKPLAEAGRILLIAVGRADNAGSKITFKKTVPMPQGGERGLDMTQIDPGAGPVLYEPIDATIELKAGRYRLTPLGPDLVPIAAGIREFAAESGRTAIEIGSGETSIWYLIERL
jgi:hypothetical protein